MPSDVRRRERCSRLRTSAWPIRFIPVDSPILGPSFLATDPQQRPSLMASPLPTSVDDTLALLGRGRYVADRSLATALFLALKLRRPLFLEGEAGVGKTEIAKVLSETLGRRLVRLQCYEGLDRSE